MMRREREKLDRSLGGIKRDGFGLPDVLFVVDVGHEKIAIHEAQKLGIPVVAIVDTNCAPDDVDYVVAGQRRRMRAIALYAEGIADAALDGKSAFAGSAGGRRRVRRARRRGQAEAEGRSARTAPAAVQPPCARSRRRAGACRRRCRRPSRWRRSSLQKSTTSRRMCRPKSSWRVVRPRSPSASRAQPPVQHLVQHPTRLLARLRARHPAPLLRSRQRDGVIMAVTAEAVKCSASGPARA